MESLYAKKFARLFLLATSICIVAGCGSSGSTASSPESSGTGSMAAKLIWSSAGSKTTAKTLYAAPAGVVLIKVFVYDANRTLLILPQDFTATPGIDGSGTIDGIPVGTGRVVKAWGLDSSGVLLYEGIATADIAVGPPTVVPISMAPITTASPGGGPYNSPQSVTLTATVPATIYYTTNGTDPTTGSTNGPSPVIGIPIVAGPTLTLKYFAIANGISEAIKSHIYSIVPLTTATPPGGSYNLPQSVTLTTSEPATIYYTTNGDTPTTGSNSGPSPISSISVAVNSFLKFFAIDSGGTQEAVKSESYHNP